MVSLLSLTEPSLTPAEVMDGCDDCPVAETDAGPAQLDSPSSRDQLPS
jgi:hypothetical protein